MTQILYTSKGCPFCARAICALKIAKIDVELRYVDYNKMPDAATNILKEASVPLLVHPDNSYINESWDIVLWALKNTGVDKIWLGENNKFVLDTEMLIETYDHSFYPDLKTYTQQPYNLKARKECEEHIEELEDMLTKHDYLLANHMTVADISIIAFIHLFSLHEPQWFAAAAYPKCQQWLKKITHTPYFKATLNEHILWQQGDDTILL